MDKIITTRVKEEQYKKWNKLGKKIGRKRSKELRDLLDGLFKKYGLQLSTGQIKELVLQLSKGQVIKS